MQRGRNQTKSPNGKAPGTPTLIATFFIPLILATAYLNMGQTCCSGNCPPPPPPDFRISKSSGGTAADAYSCCAFASSQGNDIAFASSADNLDPAAAGAHGTQIFVHNIVTKDTTWVNLRALGQTNSEGAASAVLSDNGRYIAFWERFYYSTKSVIFRDLDAQPATYETLFTTSSVSTFIGDVTMSGDARYVAFSTNAPFPGGGDTNDESDVFIKDRQTGDLTRASLQAGNVQYTESANSARLSRDGVWIAFQLNTIAEGDNEIVVQRVDGTGSTYRFPGSHPSISDDGSLIAYQTLAGPYGNDTVFVFDRVAGTHAQASINDVGHLSFSRCENPVTSGNGRYVAFNCLESMIFGAGYSDQIYVRDLVARTTKLASVNPDSEPANNVWSFDTKALSMPSTGNALILQTDADNLGNVPGGFPQIFRVPSSYWVGDDGGSNCASNDATCDGDDDDCDGQTDEDYVSQSTSCGVGGCASTGLTSCVGGAVQDSCVPLIGIPEGSVCNGLDDDCDGLIDEDYIDIPSTCGSGPCESTGLLTCQAGVVVDTCTPGAPTATDDTTCDGIDDDCDGAVDEDCCVPATCQDYNINCGTVDDGCGVPLDCGTCQSPETCGGGGVANVCGVAIPPDPSDVAPMEDVGTGSMVESFGFLVEGPTPVQTGVQAGAIEPQRAALARGQVQSHNGQALPGVTIQVKHNPSLGQTVSRSDGRYDLLINGGGNVTLEFAANGYLPIQRTVRVPWSGFLELEPVAMTVQSDVATSLVFDASSTDPQVAIGRVVDDGEGQRQVVGFLPAGVQATAEIDGATIPVSGATLRMTEYTVGSAGPRAMPGVLPDNSLYTFAVDISLDEVGPTAPVEFDKTTFFYVDNFLNLPVGAIVPNGRYDYETSRWVAERNGLVMAVVDVVDGLAEIDATDGDTDPEDQTALDELRMTDDERREIALRYPIGATFWRMPIDHLSAYDWNFAGVGGDPPPPGPPSPDDPAEPDDDDGACGSIIHCQSRKLSEEIPIAGTPYYLRYDSDRSAANVTAGRTAIIPLPEDPPAGASAVRVQASVLGREVLDETLSLPLTETSRTIVWDGLDTYGRPWVGTAELEYSISYSFTGVYQLAMTRAIPPWEARSFGVPVCNPANDPCCVRTSGGGGGGFSMTSAAGRSFTESNLAYEGKLPLGNAGAEPYRLGGWSLSHYHVYDQASGTLHLGNGQTRSVTPPGDLMANFVTGSAAGFIDGYTMIEPRSIAVGPDGDAYVAAQLSYGTTALRVVWRVDPDGALSPLFAVDEQACYSIEDLAVDSQGVLHYLCVRAPSGSGVYRAVEETDGTWTHEILIDGATVDGGPAWTDGLPLGGSFFRAESLLFREDGTLFLLLNEWPSSPGPDVYRLVEYLPNGDGAVVASSTRMEFASAGPNNTIVAPYSVIGSNGLDGQGVAQLFPDGSSTLLATPAGSVFGREEVGFEWKSTETHGPSNSMYAITTAENGDVFVSAYGGATSGGSDALYQISRGAIRRISLSDVRVPDYSGGDRNADALAAAPDGSIYIADRSHDSIYALQAGGYAREVASRDGAEIYSFSAAGLHESTRDASSGDVLFSFAHDSDGYLFEVVDRNGHVTRIDRPDSSSIVITAPPGPGAATGVQTTLQLSDSTGHLELVTDPRQGKWFFEYASGGLLERLWNPRANAQGLQSGIPFVFAYEQFKSTAATEPEANARWLLKSDDDPAGGSQTLALDHARQVTPIYGTWCNGQPYVRGYEVQSVTSEVTRTTADQRVTRYTTTTSIDAPVTTTRTDPSGWYVTRTDPDGEMTASASWPEGSSSTTYTSHPTLGDTVRVPASSMMSYDPVGNHGPLQLDASYVHDSTYPSVVGGFPTPDTEIVTTTFTPTGAGGTPREIESSYDASTRTLTLRSGGRLRYTLVLDDVSRVSRLIRPGQVPIDFDYFFDPTGDEGYLHTVTRDKGGVIRKTTFGYDEKGYVNSVSDKVSDSESEDVALTNDSMGFTTSTEVTGLSTVGQTPDIAGSLASLTPGDKPDHQFAYTPLGQLAQYAPPGATLSSDGNCPLGTQCWSYTLDRELDEVTLPDGTIVDYEYHPTKGTLEWTDVPRHDGPAYGHDRTSFGYDTVGRRISATGPTGATMVFGWQSSLPILTTWTGQHSVTDAGSLVWSGRLDGSVERFYNDFGEISDLNVSGGASLQLYWDAHGLLERIEGLSSATLTMYRSPIDGHLASASLDRVTVEQDVDVSDTTPGFGDLEGILACLNVAESQNCDASTQSLYDAAYTFDDLGRIRTWTESVQDGTPLTRRFTYDEAGRLRLVEDITGGEPGSVLEEYDYDANGNRTKALSSYPGAVVLNAELGINLGCTGPSGDTAANDQDQSCEFGDYSYAYNDRGQLSSRESGGVTTQFFYDGRGRLKRVSEPGMDIHYVHDALGRRIGKVRDGALEKGWLYKDSVNPVAQLDSSGNVEATFVYGTRRHVPDAMVMTNGTVYRFVFDHLGSVRLVVDVATGEIAQRIDYDAFGRVLNPINSDLQPFGFAGGLYDDDTGLVRFGARDYDAYAGTWTSRDAILFAGGDSNLYAYVGNDPVNEKDPLGTLKFSGNSFGECMKNCQSDISNDGSLCAVTDPIDAAAHALESSGDPTGASQTIGFTLDIASNNVKVGVLVKMCAVGCTLHLNSDHLDDLGDFIRGEREQGEEAPRPPEAPDGPLECLPEDGLMCVP